MVRNSLRVLTAIIVIATFAVIPAGLASAQSASQAITISPASTRLSIDPGASTTESFEIINGGADGYTVDLTTAPYRVVGETYSPEFTQLPGTVDASEWVKLQHSSEFLDGYKVLSTSYTVSVPANTAPGGYYAVIFAQTSQEQSSETSGVIPHNRVGNILYITVNGDVKKSGSVAGDALPFVSFSPNIPLNIKVTNDGGVHFETKVTFRVTDITGKEIYQSEQDRIVLPSTVRDISTTWESGLPVGIYTVERQATVAGETMKLDSQKIVIISPWFLICSLIFIGSVIALFVLRVRQRKKEK